MPRPRKLALAAAEAVVRQADPEVWDAMSPVEPESSSIVQLRLGVLAGSILSAVAGYAVLRLAPAGRT